MKSKKSFVKIEKDDLEAYNTFLCGVNLIEENCIPH